MLADLVAKKFMDARDGALVGGHDPYFSSNRRLDRCVADRRLELLHDSRPRRRLGVGGKRRLEIAGGKLRRDLAEVGADRVAGGGIGRIRRLDADRATGTSQQEMVRDAILIEPHRRGAALLHLRLALQLREVRLVGHAGRHRMLLRPRRGSGEQEGDGNDCECLVHDFDATAWSGLQGQAPGYHRAMGELITIGKVAAATSMTPDTIRYYERLGLVPKATRTAAGYRVYPPAVIHRLAVVRNAQRFGFSLKEIASFLGIRERGGRPCRDVRSAAQGLLEAVDREIAELVEARERMQRTLAAWDGILAATPADRPAYLLEALSASPDGAPRAATETLVRRPSPRAPRPGRRTRSRPR
jgi:DNA-binding transcriptional MerR regulator